MRCYGFFSFSPLLFSPRRSSPRAGLFPSNVAASPLLFALGRQTDPGQACPRPAAGLASPPPAKAGPPPRCITWATTPRPAHVPCRLLLPETKGVPLKSPFLGMACSKHRETIVKPLYLDSILTKFSEFSHMIHVHVREAQY